MSDVDIKYKSQTIASMDASGTKTLETSAKYCEDDIVVEYTKPSAGVTAEPLSVTENGTYTAPTGKAYTPVTVAVPQGIPVDVSTSAGMTAVLTAANAGKAYRFTGTTDSDYINGDIYVVEVT